MKLLALSLQGETALSRLAARRMPELLEARRTVESMVGLSNVVSTEAVLMASLLAVRTQIESIKSKQGTRSFAQSVAAVMACRREDCPQREREGRGEVA